MESQSNCNDSRCLTVRSNSRPETASIPGTPQWCLHYGCTARVSVCVCVSAEFAKKNHSDLDDGIGNVPEWKKRVILCITHIGAHKKELFYAQTGKRMNWKSSKRNICCSMKSLNLLNLWFNLQKCLWKRDSSNIKKKRKKAVRVKMYLKCVCVQTTIGWWNKWKSRFFIGPECNPLIVHSFFVFGVYGWKMYNENWHDVVWLLLGQFIQML